MELKRINILDIPEDLIHSGIFGFLKMKDLFFSIRGVCIEFAEIMKETYNEKNKNEISKQLMMTEFSFERESIKKILDKKKIYLSNYKEMLNVFTGNNALRLGILFLIEMLNDSRIKTLISFFFKFLALNEPLQLIEQSIDDLLDHLGETEEFEEKIDYFTSTDLDRHSFYTIDQLYKLKDEFDKFDQSVIEGICDSSKILYSFTSYMIVFNILKLEIKMEISRIHELNETLKKPITNWKEKQFFYEGAFKLVNISK